MSAPIGLASAADLQRLRLRYRDVAHDDLLLRGNARHLDWTAEQKDKLMVDAQAGDIMSTGVLLRVHNGLVEHFVRRLWGYLRSRYPGVQRSFGIDDLRQVARMGVLRALEKFDRRRGVTFSTYAAYWIKARMQRFVADTLTQIRVPAWARQQYASPKERRQALKTHIREAVEAVHLYDDVDGLPLHDERPTETERDRERRSQLRHVHRTMARLHKVGRLKSRDIEVLMRRFSGEGETLRQIGDSMRVTRECIRQVEERALNIIRQAVSHPELMEAPPSPRLRVRQSTARATVWRKSLEPVVTVPAPRAMKAPKAPRVAVSAAGAAVREIRQRRQTEARI